MITETNEISAEEAERREAAQVRLIAQAEKAIDDCYECSRLGPPERDQRVAVIIADVQRVQRRHLTIPPAAWMNGRRARAVPLTR